MSIPRQFIDDLLSRVDIVEVISARINLRKAGGNFTALCPFHNEKTPSFSVNTAKQFFYCFGCGAHGDALRFIMQFDRLEFLDAVTVLAAQVGLEVPKNSFSQAEAKAAQQNKTSYELLAQVTAFYQQQLELFEKAKKYLAGRKVAREIVRRFAIGYAPPRGGLEKQYSKYQKELIINGILIKSDTGRLYDRFHDRIMFPIRDLKGRVLTFAGRSLGDELPKYLNSPETPLFHKSDELYGLYEARKSNSKLDKIIVVEGYMDVVALAQHGINFAVATMGTAITTKHVQKLFRETTDIVFCFDGDAAGRKAAWRALEITLPVMRDGVKVRFLFLPEGEDPDSLVRKIGGEAFAGSLTNTLLLADFFFEHLCTGLDIATIDGRASLVKSARELLDKMPNGIFKELLWQQLSKIVRMDSETIKNASVNLGKRDTQHLMAAGNQQQPATEVAIGLLLHHPPLAREIDNIQGLSELEKLDMPYMEILTWLIKLLHEDLNITTSGILECSRSTEEVNFLARLLVKPPLIAKDALKSEFLGIIERLHLRTNEVLVENFMQKASRGELSGEEKLVLQDLIKKTKY